ncbi:MAG TPA: NAD(P)/FAD-dependent oxidoreductase [Opitutaceae bacterium]|nr:NAD(P)/FAD-dependent oxidoreductase [Opitutaceae bacterium]
MAALPHVVVLGAGFCGLEFCRRVDSTRVRVTVVDRQNHHLFQPLLYQVATAGLSAIDVARPIRGILRRKPNLDVRMAHVNGVDFARHCVRLEGQPSLEFDYLLLALGGRSSYFGHDEWAEHAPGLKTLDDAVRIRRQLLLAFEQAETETDPERQRELMTIVVIGGGPTGVELAGAAAELARGGLRGDFDRIDTRRARILLIEGGAAVLAHLPPALSASARRQLERLGVEVRTGRRVQQIGPGTVDLGDETIRAANILWAAGVAPVPVIRSLGVPLDRAGRIEVEPDLSVPGRPAVFAGGDIVAVSDGRGGMVPGVAPAAMQMGRFVARVISDEARLGGLGEPRTRPSFRYVDKGTLATIGRSAAVAQIGRLRFAGLFAWITWLLVHLVFLVGFRNRVAVFATWVTSYFTYRRRARIILGSDAIVAPPRPER